MAAQEIVEHLYLGSLDTAMRDNWLRENKITQILDVGNVTPSFIVAGRKGTSYLSIDIRDLPTENIGQFFTSAFDYIDEARKKGNILVHCLAGVSRSATIIASYLMKKYNMTAEQAVNYIRQHRAIVNPNPGFLMQLAEYQQFLQKGS